MSEEMIVRHCSPTLAGIKTGSIFNCYFESEQTLRGELRALNCRFRSKGLRFLPLRIRRSNALIYVYRPSKLKQDLTGEYAAMLLARHGYEPGTPEQCLVRLRNRLRTSREFPHEIGLFLGYPPEDVDGFIQNGAQCAKCVGCWKVYGDEQRARKLFAKYKKCTEVYAGRLKKGDTMDRLTVAVP